jgi:hypothetical protein
MVGKDKQLNLCVDGDSESKWENRLRGADWINMAQVRYSVGRSEYVIFRVQEERGGGVVVKALRY